MSGWSQRLAALARAEWQHLIQIQRSDRIWQMPVAAALATGLPLLVGAWFGHIEYGLVSSLGGLVFVHMPATAMQHRMVTLMACAFAMTACYATGVLCHFAPGWAIPALAFLAAVVTMLVRLYAMGPPGSLFFVMAAAIGAYSPVEVLQLPHAVGLLFLGAFLAVLIGFAYSLYALRLQAPQPVAELPPPSFDFVIFDSVVIGAFVGLSLALAQVLGLSRPYWVPVTCLAVIQGVSLRAVWVRQLHRVLGTAAGLLLSWAVLSMPLGPWSVALVLMLLSFVVEISVVRHYGFAVMFITPMTILLADAAHLGEIAPGPLVQARFADTALGCGVALLGAICLHNRRFRAVVGRPMRRLIPPRLLR
ncbi:hypothetical protein CKO44_22445 [Rubrivivax gelatinosus]|uniref:Integral membrane bound transporter domain-containing protein n=1 Tax=Rubrivivax gelatinosus TaxID=28068 RepID=A0ABS1DRE0_RUBGE|nr:FUSC family protein [Rubrivivax gelatinosus]MBK1616218.1 hypothetical protein [Rubrivivax gelatinosus]MBK1712023.1 hypothetical protein [Rubrivivax gelatinosus]